MAKVDHIVKLDWSLKVRCSIDLLVDLAGAISGTGALSTKAMKIVGGSGIDWNHGEHGNRSAHHRDHGEHENLAADRHDVMTTGMWIRLFPVWSCAFAPDPPSPGFGCLAPGPAMHD